MQVTLDADGTALTRVSFCNTAEQPCDNVQVAPAPDARRLAVRRILDPRVGERVFILDTSRGVEGEITPQVPSAGTPTGTARTSKTSSIDWSPLDDILGYSAQVGDTLPDLFRTIPRPDPNGAGTGSLTVTPALREGGIRIDPTGSVAVFVRNEQGARSAIYLFLTGTKESVAALTRAVGFRYVWDEATKQFAHPAGLLVATPEGKISELPVFSPDRNGEQLRVRDTNHKIL